MTQATTATTTDQSDPIGGIVAMVAAMTCFIFSDVFAKLASETLPVGEVIVPVPIEVLLAEIDAAFAREYGKAYRVRLLPEGYGGRHVEEPAP